MNKWIIVTALAGWWFAFAHPYGDTKAVVKGVIGAFATQQACETARDQVAGEAQAVGVEIQMGKCIERQDA
jgi:hypothetical protein